MEMQMYNRKQFSRDSGDKGLRHSPSAIGGNMRHFFLRTKQSCVFLAALLLVATTLASAQTTPKKDSVWDRIKKAGQQQGQPQQQPQPSPQQGQRQDGRGRPSPQNQSPINASGPFK